MQRILPVSPTSFSHWSASYRFHVCHSLTQLEPQKPKANGCPLRSTRTGTAWVLVLAKRRLSDSSLPHNTSTLPPKAPCPPHKCCADSADGRMLISPPVMLFLFFLVGYARSTALAFLSWTFGPSLITAPFTYTLV